MTKKKCALVLITGDRVDYIDSSIKSCLNLINKYNSEIETDIYLICFDGVKVVSNNNIKTLSFDRPTIESDIVLNFPRSIQQVNNYSNDIELTKRISLGHLILFGLVPDTIFKNINIFSQYDYILKSRADLVFDFNENDIINFNPSNQLLTFECFWGGCRYNSNFTNDHFVFGESSEVLKLISFPINECIIDKFWNPEQYMTYIFTKSSKSKVQISTDKYYLLSKDRDSRKWIGFPLEKINKNDINFLKNMDIDITKIKFTNEYENINSCSIVIARYNEDLSWSSLLNKNLKIYLYNKGNEIISNSLNLPNIGRESDTFLHHIIENYDTIDDFTIFLQGNPFFHYYGIIEFINGEHYKKQDIFFVSNRIETDDINGLPNHGGLKISNVLNDMGIKFDQDIKFKFSAGAQYCVHKKFIHNKSLDWWKKLYQVHNKYLNIPGISGSPWIFERIWPLIWSIEEK